MRDYLAIFLRVLDHGLAVRRSRLEYAALGLMLAGLWVGCATNDRKGKDDKPGSGAGVRDYQQLTVQAKNEVHNALGALERIAAETNRCADKLVLGFSDQVTQLEVESLRIRARAQTIQARGEAYLDAWSSGSNGLGQTAPQPAERLPQMRQSFDNVKLASAEVSTAFRPFLSGLHKLRTRLELDPGTVQKPETRELIRTTREQGQQVVRDLEAITNELQVLAALLVPGNPTSIP
jgi:hypothetical protein